MLKVDSIEFRDSQDRTYTIRKHQLEAFPIVGGNRGNNITTRVFNQHGNTFVESYMDSEEESITFAIYTADKSNIEIEEARKEIAKICNPINGKIEMKVTLNSGSVYYREITFVSAPTFPIGRENRNPVYQKVLLQFEANNPFWYSEEEINETFQAVTPLLYFPFTMSTTDPLYMGSIQPNNIAINEGHVEAPVTIRIYGACVNPRIDNITTGEYMKFNNLTMVATDVLEINTAFGEKYVKLNGITSVFNKLDYNSTFFNLKVGSNEIKFSDDTGSTTAAIHFVYKNLFISI
jgi:Phage tail protein